MKKVYLIGKIPDIIDQNTIEKFYLTEMKLKEMKLSVINPLKRLLNNQQTLEIANKKNMHDLMFADAVYIMPCTDFKNENDSIEIKLALKFNLIFFSGILDIYPSKKEIKLMKMKKKKLNLI